MSERRKILDLFEDQKCYYQQKVNEGIEQHRKGNAKLKLIDQDGNSIANASVKIKQISHEFRFGANLFMLDELETDEKNEKYKKFFSDVFNMATLPFYWNALELEKGKPRYA